MVRIKIDISHKNPLYSKKQKQKKQNKKKKQ